MTENRLIDLSNGEKCWLMIGICLGIILTFLFLYLYTYLPTISEIQKSALCGLVCGGGIVWLLGKFSWEEIE